MNLNLNLILTTWKCANSTTYPHVSASKSGNVYNVESEVFFQSKDVIIYFNNCSACVY